jgi:hypothetical protein
MRFTVTLRCEKRASKGDGIHFGGCRFGQLNIPKSDNPIRLAVHLLGAAELGIGPATSG